MTRTRRGYIARRRRTKMRLIAAGWALTGNSPQHQIKALYSAHRDRNRQKRNFRSLWITRINAVIRKRFALYCYSLFIHKLYKRGTVLNRKILAQVATFHPNCLYKICLYLK